MPEPASSNLPHRRSRILVVDDDPQVVTMIGTWLADVGDVHQATTSAQAYALATAIQPDLAIIDVILPRIDGLTLLASLRRQPGLAFMSVIVITGSDRLDIPSAAAEAGAAAVYFKPLDESDLRAAVSSLLRPHPAGRSLPRFQVCSRVPRWRHSPRRSRAEVLGRI